MKTALFYILILVVPVLPLMSQVNHYDTPPNLFPSHQIQVSEKSTTVLVFPFTVLDADRGSSELSAEQVPSVANVIKIKAASNQLDTTTLHVFCADGNIYEFEVIYTARPMVTTYNLTGKYNIMKNVPLKLRELVNEEDLKNTLEKARVCPAHMNRSKRRFDIKLSLRGVSANEGLLLLRFTVSNKSNLSYQADFASLYISDKKKAKRTSIQQIPITPVYTDSLPSIDGNGRQDWIIAIPKTTIPNGKQMNFELLEKNGGRNIKISIRNKDLFKAKEI